MLAHGGLTSSPPRIRTPTEWFRAIRAAITPAEIEQSGWQDSHLRSLASKASGLLSFPTSCWVALPICFVALIGYHLFTAVRSFRERSPIADVSGSCTALGFWDPVAGGQSVTHDCSAATRVEFGACCILTAKLATGRLSRTAFVHPIRFELTLSSF